MLADLERLIALQRLDSASHDAQQRLAEEPERSAQLAARLDASRQHLAAEKARLADNQAARRSLEKDAAVHQTRLSKFKDQLMAVKTNVEYQAMQKEIAFADGEVKSIEERILEQMLAGDEIAAAVKKAEAELAAEEKAVAAERKAMDAELAGHRASLEKLAAERGQVAARLDPKLLDLFETISSRRHGVALAEAREGICTVCHVRLRPQVFNEIRRNDAIIQCDSCHRILYFVVPAAPAAADGAAQAAPPQ
jgi:predicted  nucleic acid-binding Zn-ribbon protein